MNVQKVVEEWLFCCLLLNDCAKTGGTKLYISIADEFSQTCESVQLHVAPIITMHKQDCRL